MQKERNGFLPMAIGLMIILLAVAVYQYANYNLPSVANYQEATSSNQVVSDTSSWKTYKDNQSGFSINYPADFTLRDDSNGNLVLEVPVKNYFKTVLTSEANLTISNPAKTCPASMGERLGATTTVSFNGGTFNKVSWSGVGAGNIYEGADYTLILNANCYSIHMFLHSANGAGLYTSDPAEIVKMDAEQKNDKAAFLTLADKIVSTFKFTK